jgi:type III pantothenate kinase
VNIVIDQGNTSVKIALLEEDRLLHTFCFDSITVADLQNIVQEYRPEKGIFCSVGQWDSAFTLYLNSSLSSFFELNSSLQLPLILNYKTPRTLGSDRIAAAVGAHQQKPDENILVIDIGTAITFDFIEKGGIYSGGNISPGPDLRFKSLHDYTHSLPLIDENGDLPDSGYDTATAIRAGVINGIVREIDSYIEEFKKKHNGFVFLTGGYSFYFESKLKNPIFADANLILKGLNEILNFQKNIKQTK